MNIVNFTPISALIGGIIIGLAVVIFFLFNGRLIGISGIAANALNQKERRIDNILFFLSEISLMDESPLGDAPLKSLYKNVSN